MELLWLQMDVVVSNVHLVVDRCDRSFPPIAHPDTNLKRSRIGCVTNLAGPTGCRDEVYLDTATRLSLSDGGVLQDYSKTHTCTQVQGKEVTAQWRSTADDG